MFWCLAGLAVAFLLVALFLGAVKFRECLR